MPKDLTTGRIYRETVSGVTYGVVDPSDVGPIIGSSSTDIATLCTHSSINPDALFKPYEHTNPDNPNFATGGPDGKYGFTIPSGEDYDWRGPSFRNELWEFNPPETWFNLIEFDRDKIKDAGYADTVVVLLTNSDDYNEFAPEA